MVYHLSPHKHSSYDAESASTVEWIKERFSKGSPIHIQSILPLFLKLLKAG